ncbi:hypothetical protein BN2475_400097 [Paraburkholderia ribeironis]|uniref:Uncharacterized protein n=1 Tax=Paraburkholderia ribeironis TaxID=1247936 RepID=A0A1N7S6R9_9BURK|nr:hypothetical protein BN2475_400097 [Paraburkholderia ribeironis]
MVGLMWDVGVLLSRNVGQHEYVSNHMHGMPDMSRLLYRSGDGKSRRRAARIHLRPAMNR